MLLCYLKRLKIDWNNKGERIINTIRCLKPWPAYTIYKGQNVKYMKLKTEKFSEMDNGVVQKVSQEGILSIALIVV